MDKDLLALYIEHQMDENDVVVTSYNKEWSKPDNDYCIITHYQNVNNGRPYMTQTFFIVGILYDSWEKIYLRRHKLNKLIYTSSVEKNERNI